MSKPRVDLLGPEPCGAMLAWYEPASRDLALTAVLDAVQEFLGLAAVAEIALVSTSGSIRVTAVGAREFLTVAPTVLTFTYRYSVFDLWLNGSRTGFEVGHLDQSMPGVHFGLVGECGELERERMFAILERTLVKLASKNPNVDVALGEWFDGRA